MGSWQVVVLEPARAILGKIGVFLMDVFLVIILLVLGWLVSKLIKTLVIKVLRAVRLDELSERIELENLLARGGIKYSLSELIGVICYWLGILVTFMVAVNAIGLTVAADLLNKIVLYVPNIIAALFILVLGMFVATILKSIIHTAANNAGISHGQVLSKVVEVVVIAFSIFVALEQLKIGIRITQLTLSIVLGAIGLAFALAFGLGCKDIAGRYTADLIEKLKKK